MLVNYDSFYDPLLLFLSTMAAYGAGGTLVGGRPGLGRHEAGMGRQGLGRHKSGFGEA